MPHHGVRAGVTQPLAHAYNLCGMKRWVLQVPPRLELDLDEKDEDNCTPLHVALLGGPPRAYELDHLRTQWHSIGCTNAD